MIVGTCEIEILIPTAYSLKEKRHVLKSIIERLKSRFNASVAEVDFNDIWNKAMIGVAVVGNKKAICEAYINSIIDFIDKDGRVEIINYSMEVL
jgi:uncharacterized protein YlxP (DUF503 family)